jgi:hypothetical protein
MNSFEYVITRSATEKMHYKPVSIPVDRFIDEVVTRGHPLGTKEGSGIVAATFPKGSRLNSANVLTVTAIILDIDGKMRRDGSEFVEVIDPDWLLQRLPFRGVAHTSYNHSLQLPKFRVILPLDSPISKAQALRLWWWIYEQSDRKCDPACKNADRMYYLARTSPERREAHWIRRLGGPLLSLNDVPTNYAPQADGRVRTPLVRARQSQRVRFVPAPQQEALAVLRSCLKHPVVAWALAEHAAVDREVWRALATNLAAAALGHEDLLEFARDSFHEISEVDERYRKSECEEVFSDAVKSAEAGFVVRFETMRLHGAPAGVCTGGTSLVHAARQSARGIS